MMIEADVEAKATLFVMPLGCKEDITQFAQPVSSTNLRSKCQTYLIQFNFSSNGKRPFVVICVQVFWLFSPAIKAESQLSRETVFWQQALDRSSLVEIARRMRETTNPWPQVDAAQVSPFWQVDLINQLHRTIRHSFNPNAPTNPDMRLRPIFKSQKCY